MWLLLPPELQSYQRRLRAIAQRPDLELQLVVAASLSSIVMEQRFDRLSDVQNRRACLYGGSKAKTSHNGEDHGIG